MAPHPDLADYAADARQSRGRLHPETPSAHRSPFQRDRDRIIHSAAFRRLKHKTQVFVEHEGDHFRTRLTHSLEVAQIARTLARTLSLDEDLAEAVALAHDLGHTPFGHTGEDALDACMAPWGGFDHNAQALRIVTSLEQKYPAFDGLNLSWETLEGIAKHNGPLLDSHDDDRSRLPGPIAEYDASHGLALHGHASAEAQVAALSDDIAYNNHDLDDGLRAGLFSVADIADLPVIGPAFHAVAKAWPGLDPQRLQGEALRRSFGTMVEDVVAETQRRLRETNPRSMAEVQTLGAPVVAFSDEMAASIREIRAFLMRNMYRHWRVARMRSKAARVVRALFDAFVNEPGLLPPEWQGHGVSEEKRVRLVADYIAGMTDRFALQEHRALIDPHARA